MYSLYRAWLSMGPMPSTSLQPPMPNAAPLNLTAPPLQPQPQLSGAPDVNLQVGPGLTNFSAHKNVLSAHSGFFKAALATVTGFGPILVPNINVDEFSSLLTFMYTGYLDLNLTNIYNILLATHILHMPRALEICRTFLMQAHQPLETARINSGNIIKPIASRKTTLPHQEIYAPSYTKSLVKSEETPFRKIEAGNSAERVEAQASTSKEVVVEVVEKKEKQLKVRRKEAVASCSGNSEKVIIDIACCDGPVRFHRVINKNYGLTQAEEVLNPPDSKVNRNDVLNKVMNENIRDKQQQQQATDAENQTQNNNEVFTCLYCNHTFKSQYCYQKHARRHLHPVVDAKKAPVKREVKQLDMNVQYYPCKTCGSKFPSYYFVHKHRKLCHADEMADNTNKNNEIVQVKSGTTGEETRASDTSSKNSIIDVEETDNN